jgi:hypothetical protein
MKDTAADFAAWITENKPHLVEIEDEIQRLGLYGELDIRLTVRGGRVERLAFYGGRTWLRDKPNLTQQP